MPGLILTAIGYVRGSKAARWVLVSIGAGLLCWAAVAMFRSWIADGKDEAVALDRAAISTEANERVVNAIETADANQMARDEIDEANDRELRNEATTKSDASSVGPGVQSVLDRMREQQAAGRRR